MHCISNALAVAEYSVTASHYYIESLFSALDFAKGNNKNVGSIIPVHFLLSATYNSFLEMHYRNNVSFDARDHKEASNYTQ